MDLPYGSIQNCRKDYCEGWLWIYFSDDHCENQWGTISNDMNEHTRRVTCRQLGYKSSHFNIGDPTERPVSIENTPVWLANVKCPINKEYSNILQCEKRVPKSTTNHENDVYLTCGE